MITISDALPIQFWDADDETFNEKEICGINPQCFCLPIECDDIISGQFNENYGGFDLGIYSDSGLIDSFPLEEVSTGVWGFSFSFSDYTGLCDQQIQLKVTLEDPILAALSTWGNLGTGKDWTTGANPARTLSTAFDFTKKLASPFVAAAWQQYQFNYDFDISGYLNLSGFGIALLDDSLNVVGYYGFNTIFSDGNYSGIASITPSANSAYISYGFAVSDLLSNVTIDINSTSYIAQNVKIIKKSDCLNVKEIHDCTKLIEYSNESDFDGISYSDISPRPTFYLRIPAMFFEEENPQEQEDLVLSNGVIVTLRQEIQEKRLLETGYMPNYMHKKLQKVLMHESITIDGDGWKRRDAYEPNPIKKYALKRASVLLTKYNSVLKNTI